MKSTFNIWTNCLTEKCTNFNSSQTFLLPVWLPDWAFVSFGVSCQPVLHDWCNKGHGMRYPVCGMMHIKEYSVLIRKSSPCCSSGFPHLLSEWFFTICTREREIFYLTTHSTHFIYGYMASDIWLRTILIVRKETRCRHIGYSYRLTARVLLYAPSHRQDNTYHSLCYTSRGALAGTRNSSMGPPHEGSIRRPIAPWANALPLSYVPLPPYVRRHITVNKMCWGYC